MITVLNESQWPTQILRTMVNWIGEQLRIEHDVRVKFCHWRWDVFVLGRCYGSELCDVYLAPQSPIRITRVRLPRNREYPVKFLSELEMLVFVTAHEMSHAKRAQSWLPNKNDSQIVYDEEVMADDEALRIARAFSRKKAQC